jgi:Ser/Thr protein kinase RdoA (MazF antagonist)
MVTTVVLRDDHVAALSRTFRLGSRGRLSDGPVGAGRVGAVWRLRTDQGPWAVKPLERDIAPDDLAAVRNGAAFQEAALQAGVPTPAVRRAASGDVIADLGDVQVTVESWVDLLEPNLALDPVALGRLLATLHQVTFAGSVGRDPWYEAPVGRRRWSELLRALHAREAPFADELEAPVAELIALEDLLGHSPRGLRTCHRDLWADNVRGVADGGLCVIDFDNAGLADPAQELALVLLEYSDGDAERAATIKRAYADAGGSARVDGPADFAMPVAQLAHIVEEGCRRWLAATDEADRADNEAWVREVIDRPVTRAGIEALL